VRSHAVVLDLKARISRSIIRQKLAEERSRLEREAGLRPRSHCRRQEARPFTAEQLSTTAILAGGLPWRHVALIRAVFQSCGYKYQGASPCLH
jgi:hypothetical protein